LALAFRGNAKACLGYLNGEVTPKDLLIVCRLQIRNSAHVEEMQFPGSLGIAGHNELFTLKKPKER
jgi:hypothetical protein